MNAQRVRTVLVVTLVAVLVWLFAESRTLRAETLTIPVEISAGGSAAAFRLTDPDAFPGAVEMEVSGPAGVIDTLRARASEGIVLEIGRELPADPGERDVELIEAIRRASMFIDSGVTLRRVTPRTLAIETDRVESLMLPVEADLGELQTAGPVRIEPNEVSLRLPASVAEGLDLRAVAKIPPARLSALTPGRRSEISQVPIELEGLPTKTWGLRLLEPRVVVTLALRVRTETLTLQEVPVRLSVLPGDLPAWSIEVPPEDRVLQDVVLTGPVSAIEQIRRGEVILGAIAVVDTDGLDVPSPGEEPGSDLTEGLELVIPVRLVGLPSGVIADLDDREIRVSVTRRVTPATLSVTPPAD